MRGVSAGVQIVPAEDIGKESAEQGEGEANTEADEVDQREVHGRGGADHYRAGTAASQC